MGSLALVLMAGLAQAEETAPAAPPAVTLEHAVSQALARNPSLGQARAQVDRARALVTEARAAFLPTLTGNAVYTQLDGARAQGDRILQPASALNANVTLTVPVVAAQRWLAASRAQQSVEVARTSEADARRQVAVATAQAYLAVVLQKRLLQTNLQARDTARNHLEFARARRQQGLGNRLDEVRAERELHDDEARVSLALASVARAQEALGVAVGLEGPLDAVGEVALATLPSLQAALESVAQRDDIVAQRQRLELAERTVRESWADYMPTLSAVGQPFLQTPATSTLPTSGWQAQVLLSVPFYDGGFRYGARREREALAFEARSLLESTLQRAHGEVRSAAEQLQGAEAAAVEQQRSAASARETLELATIAYRAGATTNLDVIDAERGARDAETSELLAQDTVRQARLNFLVASGQFPEAGAR
ncbi:MAG: TolC family protein [Archangium sp.]